MAVLSVLRPGCVAFSLLSSLPLQVFSPCVNWSRKMGMRHILLGKMQSSLRSVGQPLGTASMPGSRCSSQHTPVTLPATACRSLVKGWKALREPVIKSQKIASSPAGEGRKEQGTAGVSRQGWVQTASSGRGSSGRRGQEQTTWGSWGYVQSRGVRGQMQAGDFWLGPVWEGSCVERNQTRSLPILKPYNPSIC